MRLRHPDTRTLVRRCTIASALLLFFAACEQEPPTPEAEPKPVAETELTVFAAASLRDAFTALAQEFKRAHPGVEITFNFAGTQELRTQLEHGASVDVFASADQRHMDELVHGGRVASSVVFAQNEPVIVVADEAAGRIRSLADLANAER